MNHESFENVEVAKLLNEYFVNIKVDKEERPDIDRVYMTYVQATTGSGGWPLSVFLTPDLKPFVGGTYFPPEDRYGQTGFKTLIARVHQVWAEDAKTVESKASHMFNILKTSLLGQYDAAAAAAPAGSRQEIGRRLFRHLAQRFNKEYGGFSDAPLFPRPSEMQCLLALSATAIVSDQERAQLVNMVLHTLRKMSQGGIHDHIGGGFSRYSVDECWHVPHFEKMLYDNAQLLQTFASAYRVSRDPYLASLGADIVEYIRRDMTHSNGTFYSAQDADSLPDFDSTESKEGAYYTYSRQDVIEQLPGLRGDVFCYHYNIMEGGNCNLSYRSDPQGEFQGLSVPIELGDDPVQQTAQHFKRDHKEIAAVLQDGRRTLLEYRRKARPAPVTDDKIITAWNAMMISACAQAHCAFVVGGDAHLLGRTDFIEIAIRAMRSLETDMFVVSEDTGRRGLLRSVRYVHEKPVPGPGAFADDYAWMICAYLDLYEATADYTYVQRAIALQDIMDSKFKSGNSYLSSDPTDDPAVLIQMAEVNDGAEPSPNSIALGNLYRLRNLVDLDAGQRYADMANAIWNWAQPTANEVPNALPMLLANSMIFDISADRLLKVVITGDQENAQKFLHEIFSRYLPSLSLVYLTSSDAHQFWSTVNRTVQTMAYTGADRQTQLHLCSGFTCHPPVTTPGTLSAILDVLQRKGVHHDVTDTVANV